MTAKVPFVVFALVVGACSGTDLTTDRLGPLQTLTTRIGAVLADSNGMTLYTSMDDPDGESRCLDQCARRWRPVRALPDATEQGPLTVIQRRDGIRQYAYHGRPLYRWTRDEQPRDVKGHNPERAWVVARP